MAQHIEEADIGRHRSREYNIDDGPVDPITGGASALMGTATSMMMGVADMPIQTLKLLNIHPEARDARAARKGKSKASGDDATSTGESARTGRPSAERTTTHTTDASIKSGGDTPPVQSVPGTNRSSSDTLSSPGAGTPGAPTHRSSFMSQALAESAGRSRSCSRDRLKGRRRASSISAAELRSNGGTASPGPGFAESVESAVDTGKGLARILGAGFKSPMDFSLNVAKGLHNVPKLYGAEVRQVDKVTDFQSGLRTAAKVGFLPLR